MSKKSSDLLLARTEKRNAVYRAALKVHADAGSSATTKPTAPAIRIRVNQENAPAIFAALSLYQSGRGQNHVGSYGVINAASIAQAALVRTKLPVALGRGSKFTFADGGASAKAYRYPIATTSVTLERDGRGWLLVGVEAIKQWPQASAIRYLRLTREASTFAAGHRAEQKEAAEVQAAAKVAAAAARQAQKRAALAPAPAMLLAA
jgi:hypothetical protein